VNTNEEVKKPSVNDGSASLTQVRINDQYRVTFRWEQGHAYEVRVEDYHQGSELAGAGDPAW
jgi:plasmid maintenance system killer protein